ncbi:MAG: DUF4149 domain-containing protein [Candidatus Methanofastidiosia archaeon]
MSLFNIILDFLHTLATVTWIGGMIYANLVLMPSLEAIDPAQRGKLLGAAIKRFTILAWSSIIVLLVTGILITPSGMLFDISTFYGKVLTLKHVLIFVMIVIGVRVTFVLGPKMKALAPKPGEKPPPEIPKLQNQLEMLALINMILGILVLLCVAIL